VQPLAVRPALISSQNLARRNNILWVMLLACADSLYRSTKAEDKYLEAKQQEGSVREPPMNTTQSGRKPSL